MLKETSQLLKEFYGLDEETFKLSEEVMEDVKDKFDKYGYELRQLEDYNEIVNQKQRNTPYLYYENQEGEMFIADAPIVESQFIRKLIAKDIDALDRALWNENIRKDWMIEIVKTLRPHFDNLKGTSIWE